MPRYSHILFDLDGTLIDSAPAILASFRDAFARAGLTPVIPIDDSIIGPPLTETLQLLAGSKDAAPACPKSVTNARSRGGRRSPGGGTQSLLIPRRKTSGAPPCARLTIHRASAESM